MEPNTSKHHITSQIDQDSLLAAEMANYGVDPTKDCSSDAALALLLQKQYDHEYNRQLDREEARLNGHSKVCVSLNNFKRNFSGSDPSFCDNDDWLDDETEDPGPDTAWDVFEQDELKQRSRMMGRSGFILDRDGNMITKHDIPTSSRKNVCRLMESKTDIQTGDAGATKDDFMLTNYVYNQLKVHSKKSSKKALQRQLDKRERCCIDETQTGRMDASTRSIMGGLLLAYKLEKLNGVIGHGKESTILHATGRDHNDTPGQEVAVKILKSDINLGFKTRDSYNKSKCPSYKFDRPKSKNDSLAKWAERGFKNLRSLSRANINCPYAISFKKHVLIMTFLGSSCSPSPKLKEANLDEKQLRDSYEQVVSIMKRMYQDCDLIHGDLSEYNLLWHNDSVYVIDVSQSMSSSHPAANRFLFRDCKNIIDFYTRSGLSEILETQELFMAICGKDLTDKDVELWCKIDDFPRNEKLMHQDENTDKNSDDNFVHMLESVSVRGEVQVED